MLAHTCEWYLCAYYIERIGLQRCKIAYFDEGLRQREDEHPLGAKSLLVVMKELRYAYFGNWVSLFRQTSCDFRAVLLATIVNKDSLLHVVWIHHPEKHKPWWTLWKGDSSHAHKHLKGKSNTSIVPQTYQTIRTFWYWFGALRKQAYFANWRTSGMGVWRLWKQAFDRYGYRRRVGTETGVRTSVQGKLYCDTYRTNIVYTVVQYMTNLLVRSWRYFMVMYATEVRRSEYARTS